MGQVELKVEAVGWPRWKRAGGLGQVRRVGKQRVVVVACLRMRSPGQWGRGNEGSFGHVEFEVSVGYWVMWEQQRTGFRGGVSVWALPCFPHLPEQRASWAVCTGLLYQPSQGCGGSCD